MDQQTDESQISNPMEADPGKMFVGGLHSQTTADGLQRYFEQYGEVKEAVVMRDSVTKRSRGFGFVRFNESKSVDKVANTATHTIDGKKVDPKRAIPKRPPPGQNQFKKVFVGGLPPDTTVQDIKDYFEGFGKVTEVLLMHDRNTKRLRGFGFVTFESDLAGKHVCEAGFHKLKGKSVECKSAQPKEVMMLQVPFPFGRGYPTTLGGPMGFGFPTEWALNPQIYQNIANMYSNAIYGRGRGAAATYSGYAPQGFVNMPDHRRPGQSQYYAEYANVQSPNGASTAQQSQAGAQSRPQQHRENSPTSSNSNSTALDQHSLSQHQHQDYTDNHQYSTGAGMSQHDSQQHMAAHAYSTQHHPTSAQQQQASFAHVMQHTFR